MNRFDRGFLLPMDDLRLWVKAGLAESVPWTDETERQFQIAEAAACDVASRYQDAGFAVAIDHCRNPKTLEQVIGTHLKGRNVVKACLMPSIDENLRRNSTRTNKPFGPEMLVETIRFTNAAYREAVPDGWIVIDNTSLTIDQTLSQLVKQPGIAPENL